MTSNIRNDKNHTKNDEIRRTYPSASQVQINKMTEQGNIFYLSTWQDLPDMVWTGLEPALVYDRATGYGVVPFHKPSRRIRFECWPRFSDPSKGNQGQYDDWPFEINQFDNFGFSSKYTLPLIDVMGLDNPVLKIFPKNGQELVSALRIPGSLFRLKFSKKGSMW